MVDELQGLGNPTSVEEADADSMLDLESVPDSDISEDSVQFIYTPLPSLTCSECQASKHDINNCME